MKLTCNKCSRPMSIENYARYTKHGKEYFLCLACWDSFDEADKVLLPGTPIVVRDAKAECYYSPRDRLALEMMAHLNDKQEYHTRVFDCGELGVLRIWFHRRWSYQWWQPEPLPEGVK